MMSGKDRLLDLGAAPNLNGIDFVEVGPNARDLYVHFVNSVGLASQTPAARVDGGDRVPTVGLQPIDAGADWSTDIYGNPLLMLHALSDGDFSDYRLTLDDDKLDPYFSAASFSFKVLCPSDFDCAPAVASRPPEDDASPVAIDYLAKDFAGFKQALSDFSAQRYPGWRERNEADLGVAVMEALAALGDELSYQQDRIAAEATLETATERRSLVQHARLVDYRAQPGTSARTLLRCSVTGTALPAGIGVSARDPDGQIVPFEIGTGLRDATTYRVDPRWNRLEPYYWTETDRILPAGATGLWLKGDGLGLLPGQAMLIETEAAVPADPPLRQVVYPTRIEAGFDPLYGVAITHVEWAASEALHSPRDLDRTELSANLVPCTQGARGGVHFVVDAVLPGVASTFARRGANGTIDYRFSLPDLPLAWQGDDEGGAAPEIRLRRPDVPEPEWRFVSSLLDAVEEEHAFTLEPATYRPVALLADGLAQFDYDGDAGETVRFGTGNFGAAPNQGDVFEVSYRLGAGLRGNVAADAISVVDASWRGLLTAASNPFPASGGADRETATQIRQRAPFAFQARQYRAVRAEDYEAEAQRLGWVQRAGTAFRWTGSWFTVFTAIDPLGGNGLSEAQHTQATDLLNRRRLAGYESYVPSAKYVSVDLEIEVCAQTGAFAADVEEAILRRLVPVGGVARKDAFFLADRFTFGSPLERSELESAVQEVPGVRGVLSISYRRRGVVPAFVTLPETLLLGSDAILRVDNDPSFPERGVVAVRVSGGR